jgi:Subtilase family
MDIISMSWSIDKDSRGTENPEVSRLQEVIREAGEGKGGTTLMFCAWPDKITVGSENTTYPKALAPHLVFDIGAAERYGGKADSVASGKPNFLLPGTNLNFPVKSDTRNVGRAPITEESYTGSSLSCALASGLAAMVLYCARKVKHERAESLRNHEAMKRALNNLTTNADGSIVVRETLGHPAISSSSIEPKKKREVLQKLVTGLFEANAVAVLDDIIRKRKR